MAVLEHDRAVGDLPRDQNARETAVAIAGSGLITVLGDCAEQTWEKLLRGESISDHSIVSKQWGGKSRAAGLAIDAASQALTDAQWTQQQIRSAGLVVGTSKGTVIDWLESGGADSAGVGAIAPQLQVGGPRLTVSAACASGLLALIRGALMIKSGEAQRVLVVAAEASVHELFIGSFRRLGVLSSPGKPCRPFDEHRSGFLMSEAAAAVCLERAGDSDNGDLLIEKMAMGGDATHLISGDDRATTLRRLLHDVIDGKRIDLIHAHGTGTVQNDAIELSAIDDSLAAVGELSPALYSHKGALGHSLGAAGLVSVVINRMIHQRGVVPPMLANNLMTPRRVELNPHVSHRHIRRSLAVAAGFGGAMGAVTLISTSACRISSAVLMRT